MNNEDVQIVVQKSNCFNGLFSARSTSAERGGTGAD